MTDRAPEGAAPASSRAPATRPNRWHPRLVTRLALRDLLHENQLAACSLLGLAAVLAPLIVLFGLKSGVIGGLRAEFIENPRARMVTNAANRRFEPDFLERLAARPEVAFLIPRTRQLNTEGRFERPDRPGTVVRAELMATAPGDPLLPGMPALAPGTVLPSAALAARLDLSAGTPVTLRVLRGEGSGREVLSLPLVVATVAPPAAFDREGAFVALPLLMLVDDFVDNKVPASATPADARDDPARAHAGFRAHARRLEDVVTLDRALRAEGVEVETQADQVAGLLGLDRSLTMLFATLAGLGGAGFLVSLGVGLYAGVERKRRDLSLLRLVGLSRRDLVLFPLLQAAAVGLAGAFLAELIALGVAAFVNRLSLGAVGAANGHPVCVVEPLHLLVATLVTLLGAMAAAGFAGARAARIPPSEGLRDG